ncbi:MAG: ABC transporter ATP-binding protein [Pseudomonadota bacterium]
MGLLDTFGVASIMPFIAVLANPQLVETNAMLNTAFQVSRTLGIETTEQFLIALGILVFILLLASLAFKALTSYAQTRFTFMREYSIGKRLVEGYLHQPYSWFLSRHSADLGKAILSEVRQVIDKALDPAVNLIAQGTIAATLLLLLVLVDPMLTLTITLVLGVAYGLIFKVASGLLARIGKEQVSVNQARFMAVSESFGAAKEIKVGGLERTYIQRFAAPAQTFAKHHATAYVIGLLPRFALEAIVFGGMLLIMLYLIAQSGNFATALPVIALYAFAGYRLMPTLQQIYTALTELRYAGSVIESLHNDLISLQPANSSPSHDQRLDTLPLNHALCLNDIHYTYPNASYPALNGISLTIPAKGTVGFVGVTGSGKTTTVDLILGLLEAQQGTLDVDGITINETNKRAWQRSIGYVPQQIYLADDTVAHNIAFGIEAKDIDQESIERAAKIASLHDFIISELPKQYQTTVGERGVRLSGGQRQRIGIARALYHNPHVLILDEATSALDNLTEQAVMKAVHDLGHDITIILIAHRLSTVKDCDTIFLLDKGKLKGQGNFEELRKHSESFRAMTSWQKIG